MNFVDDPESAVLAAAKDMLRRGLDRKSVV